MKNSFFLFTALATGIASMTNTSALAQTSDIASATAKTVQMTMTEWKIPKGDDLRTLQKTATFLVQYDRQGKVRVEEINRANPSTKSTAYRMVSDGKVLYETSTGNSYRRISAPPPTNSIAGTQIATEHLDLALGLRFAQSANYAVAPDETLEGKPVKVYMREDVRKIGSIEYRSQLKMFVDPATRLPIRFSIFNTVDGKTTEFARTEFADWKLDTLIDTSAFVWNAPASMTKASSAPRKPSSLLAVGTVAPNFTVPKSGGGNLWLSDYRGKVVILDFWATWCGPCRRSMPQIESVYRTVRSQDVVVLGVCVWDERNSYEKWMRKNANKYSFEFGFDPAGRGSSDIARKLYKVSGIPTTYIIDRNGNIVDAIVGSGDVTIHLEETLAKLGIKTAK